LQPIALYVIDAKASDYSYPKIFVLLITKPEKMTVVFATIPLIRQRK